MKRFQTLEALNAHLEKVHKRGSSTRFIPVSQKTWDKLVAEGLMGPKGKRD